MCPFVWRLDLVIPSKLWLQNPFFVRRVDMSVPVTRHFFLWYVRVGEVRNCALPTRISSIMALSFGLSLFNPRAFLNSSLVALCFTPAEAMIIGTGLSWSGDVCGVL